MPITVRPTDRNVTYVSIVRPAPLARAKLAAAVAAAFLGVSVALNLSPSSSRPRVANDLAPETRDASVAVPRAATMAIVPVPAINPDAAAVFIGTGDGSNGSWVRP
jgi:hypothetical protein